MLSGRDTVLLNVLPEIAGVRHTRTVRNDRQVRENSDGVRCLSKDRTRGLIEGQQEGNESTLKNERNGKMRVTQKRDRCPHNQSIK